MSEQNFSKPSNMSGSDRSSFLDSMESDLAVAEEHVPSTSPDGEHSDEQQVVASESEAVEPDTQLGETPDLEAAQRDEKRAKLDADRESFDAQRQEWQSKFDEQQKQFDERMARAEQLESDAAARSKRAKYDPAKALGLESRDDLLAASKQLYALAEAGKEGADPSLMAEANRTMQDREYRDQLTEHRDELTKIRDEIKQEREAQQGARFMSEYSEKLSGAVDEKSPITRSLLASGSANVVKERLIDIASEMHRKSGEVPDASDVVKFYEQSERTALLDRGINPDTIAKTQEQTPVAEEKPPATLTNDLGSSTQSRTTPLTRNEQMADVLKTLNSGDFD